MESSPECATICPGIKEEEMSPQEPGRVVVELPRDGKKRDAALFTSHHPFDVVESKLHVPVLRPGVVSRTALVNRLRVTGSCPVVAITAPAGYGKTTLLAQWAARDKRSFAWVSIDERDNDPIVLLRHIAASVHQIEPLDSRVLDALSSPGKSMWTAAVPRLGSVLAERDRPLVVVLDDAHWLHSRDSVGAVSSLVDHMPPGSMLVLAGRVQPRLRIAALRASGLLLALGVDELALSGREARILLASAGVDLADEDVQELVTRTEGWAAGLYLAALSLRERDGENGARPETVPFAGDDRYLADYFRAEYLSSLTPEHLTFLRRTSVLGKMCGPLCDRVLDRKDSTAELASIERSNLFLVPLDRHREWYRYHHLFHDLLSRELTETEPELVPELHRRAADWFEENGDSESALEYADASGDKSRVARLIASLALPAYESGRIKTVEGWLDRFGNEAELEQYPAVAVIGGWIHALQGEATEAKKWLDIAMRGVDDSGVLPDGSTSARPWIALLRAAMCGEGVEEMLRDAEGALDELPASSEWRPTALLLQGAAHLLLGDDERGDAILAEADEAAQIFGATDTRVVAISERSLLAAARDDPTAAEKLSVRAHELVEEGQLGGYVTSSIELAATARALLRHGRWDQARACLTAAGRLTPFLTHALPWFAVQTRLELARAHVTLRDTKGARTLLSEVRQILGVRPLLGVLGDQTDAIQAEVDGMPEAANGNRTGLTSAELRLLPLLATHLSFREIGERLHVSRNTVKTQAISVYRKLGVSNRSDAIECAGGLGLVDAAQLR
jgi:LuxR family transcriptional regulator, maltose regulon positive regulatory protein